ncbi:MAG TPA: 16S rRNA (guanine(527)-N(7))-methyltransferase RsmG [Oscillospiraceae bacterium]|nr:16S rRNA (guanine(527)-N(7))-methyltransferase RsmG [Oscillospiraceae bacterium]
MWNELSHLSTDLGISLPETAPSLFRRYYELLIYHNKQINLTRITEAQEVMIKHFLDSLMLLVIFPQLSGPLLDLGSGAGLPGIPLKLARPSLELTLLDALQKRINFLQQLSENLQLTGVNYLHGRAEDYGQQIAYREKFPLVVSRAVAKLNVLLELCLPFVAVGGFFVAYKGPEGEKELQLAEHALLALDGEPVKVWTYDLPRQFGKRSLLVIRKNSRTSARYPRKAGLPAKRPL